MMKRLFFFGFGFVLFLHLVSAKQGEKYKKTFNIGAILDMKSRMGIILNASMSMAISDFYSLHSDYQTRLVLHTKDAANALNVASSVLQLLNTGVHAIFESEIPIEDYVAEIGTKAHIPIISFTQRILSNNLYKSSPYFLQMTPDDKYQIQALAATCKEFQWHEVVILFEENEYGYQFSSRLCREFHVTDIHTTPMIPIPSSAKEFEISTELKRLTASSATSKLRVFLVHMTSPSLGSRLFVVAKELGMMSDGYAWIITETLSNSLNSMDSFVTTESMEGVLGIRPYVPRSENLENFKAKWKMRNTFSEFNVYCLWAYDAIWATAKAIEKTQPTNDERSFVNSSQNEFGDVTKVRISKFGPKLLNELQGLKFTGPSGHFAIVNHRLQPRAIEIFNMVGTGVRTIGYWSSREGITKELDHSTSGTRGKFKNVIWPGDSMSQPKGLAVPSTKRLKVRVPKKNGFTEFVNVLGNKSTNGTYSVEGFSIDIFLHALEYLPFKFDYDFIPFVNESGQSNGSYNDLLQKIKENDYDIVVADSTILDQRADYVDFALPYSESGVVMVVKNNVRKDMWIFVKPLKWDLWLTIFAACVFLSFVIRVLERHKMKNDDSAIVQQNRDKNGLFFWYPIAVLAFPEGNMVSNSWSRFVLIIWVFMSYILAQSYTASLSAILTVDRFHSVISKDYFVGYQEGSFVRDFLLHKRGLEECKLKQYSTMEQYNDAMNKGSDGGGIDAIFDEIPYMKLFLRRYGSQYRIVGPPIFKTDGFGFAFKQNSSLVPFFSRAILRVTQSENLTYIENKNFGHGNSISEPISFISEDKPSLTAHNFGGLFIIISCVTIFALFCSETRMGRRMIIISTRYGQMTLDVTISMIESFSVMIKTCTKLE